MQKDLSHLLKEVFPFIIKKEKSSDFMGLVYPYPLNLKRQKLKHILSKTIIVMGHMISLFV